MAKVAKNVITKGFTGKLDNIVWRTRNGKTSAYIYSGNKKKLTDKQILVQQKFTEAVKKAKAVILDPDQKKHFEKLSRKQNKESAYSAAIAWFMKHPEEI